MINCIELYHSETLLIEHDQNYSEDDILKLFDKEKIFHIKTYPYCSFVHFYSHHGKYIFTNVLMYIYNYVIFQI